MAVIGERPLLWTDLLRRSAATRVQIRMQTRDANVIAVQEQEMYKELLQRMIDDRLEEQQADKAHIAVTPGRDRPRHLEHRRRRPARRRAAR